MSTQILSFSTPPPFSVDENVASGSTVGTLVPTYNGDDSISSFLIIEQTPTQKFDIDNDGVITTTGDLDFEEAQSYTLSIDISDGSFLMNKSITIDINNLDEAVPTIDANQMFSIDENSSIGSLVGNVLASDDGIGVTMYSITAGNGSPAVFSIDNTGRLTTAEAIDFETTANYTLTIEVEDAAGKTANNTIIIEVNDLDDEPPTIPAGQVFDVNENKPANTAVGSVIASDNVGVTSYAIIAGDTKGQFTIDNNGNITVAKNIDYETTTSFTLTVEVMDAASQSATEDITITINDIFDEFTLAIESYSGITIANNTISVVQNASSSSSILEFDILSYNLTTGAQNTDATITVSLSTLFSITDIVFLNNQFWIVNASQKINVIHADGSLDSASDFDIEITSTGIGVVNNQFWIVNTFSDKVFVYNTNGVKDTDKGFDLHANNGFAQGIAHYNNHFYIADGLEDHIYVYTANGVRNESLEIDVTATIPSNVIRMTGITFHNNLFYVLDGDVINSGTDDVAKVYLFKADGTRPN